MKVIGAGFPRTGTMSLKHALNILGYNAYHMEEVAKNHRKGHVEMWHSYLTEKADMDWDKLFEGYDATTDFPAAYYYKELIRKYPDAKVVLGVRDAENWYKSIHKLMGFARKLPSIFFIPFVRRMGIMANVHFDLAFGKERKKEDCIQAFLNHIEEVKQTVPPERLLVFSAKQGWQPLCNFLEQPIPDTPFPHSNAGMNTLNQKLRAIIGKEIWRSPFLWALIAAVIAFAAYFLWG